MQSFQTKCTSKEKKQDYFTINETEIFILCNAIFVIYISIIIKRQIKSWVCF